MTVLELSNESNPIKQEIRALQEKLRRLENEVHEKDMKSSVHSDDKMLNNISNN